MVESDNCDMKIGHLIRQLRNELKLTQEELAFQIGTDAANLSRIENNKQNPAPDMLEKLAIALGLPLSQLFLMVEQSLTPYALKVSAKDQKQLQQRLTALVGKYVLLDTGNQQLILEFMTAMLKVQGESGNEVPIKHP